MLRIFKSNTPINYLVVFFVMLVLWAYKFIVMPPAVDTGGMQSYFFRLSYESSTFQYIFTIFAFALAFGFACYTSKENFQYQIVDSGYQFPALIFAMLTGSAINAQRCIPEMVASIFVALSVLRTFGTYNKQEAIKNCLDAGFLLGIAVIFAYKYILLLPAIIVIIFIVKPVSWRDLASIFISFLLVVGIAACLVWLYGNWDEMISSIKQESTKLILGEKYNKTNYLFQIPLFFSIITSLLSTFMLKVSRKTSEMKFHISMLFLLIYNSLLWTSPLMSNESVWLIYFPLCYLLTNVIVNTKRKYISYIVFYGLIFSLIMTQVLQVMYYNSIF